MLWQSILFATMRLHFGKKGFLEVMIDLNILEQLNVLDKYLKSKGTSLKEQLQNENRAVYPMGNFYIGGASLYAMELEFGEGKESIGRYYVLNPDDNSEIDYYAEEIEERKDELTITTLKGADGKDYYVVERKY